MQDVPRVLHFSPDSQTLFFNTSLDTSIHSYSLTTGCSLPVCHSHPSPPSVVAVSDNGDVFLSASASPPTILIQDRRISGTPEKHFRPTDSTTTVTCAAFEMANGVSQSPSSQFVLGFKDGTLTVYTVALPVSVRSPNPLDKTNPIDSQVQPIRLGAMTKLHRASMGGVTAAAFIPGYRSRVVSIGYDGRCRLVDFEKGAQKLRT